MSYTCRIYVFLSLQDHLGVITAAWTMCPSRQEQKPRQTSNVHNIQPLLAACESTHHNSKVWPKLYINYVIILQTEAIGNAFWNNNAEYSRVSPQLYSVTITVGKCIVQRDVTTAVSLYPFSIEVIHTRAANVKLTPGAKSHSSSPLEHHNWDWCITVRRRLAHCLWNPLVIFRVRINKCRRPWWRIMCFLSHRVFLEPH